jgi:integrase
MATVIIQKRKRKKGMSYIISFKEPLTGKNKYYKTFRKHKDAQQAANELRSLLDSGKIPKPKRVKLNPLTFREVTQKLRQEWDERNKRNDLADKTFQEYSIWLNVLVRKFGDRRLCQLNKGEVKSFRNSLALEYSNITANKYLSMIRKVFQKGLEIKAVVEDPTQDIPFLNEKDHERNRFILPPDLDNLIAATQQTRAKFYLPAVIYLGAEHGASKQEILSLEWSDINFDFKELGLIRFFRTKNKKERTEFLMPRTKKALLEWKAHLEYMRHRRKIVEINSDHVFCHLNGTPLKCFNKAWWRVLSIAGIKDFHFHDLRHTFCSNLILSGANLKDAKELIGHEDITMTDRYSHLTLQYHLSKQEQLAEHYDNGKMGVG